MIRIDRRAADFFDKETADGECLISDDVGRKALAGTTGEEAVVRVGFQELRIQVGLLTIGGAGDDEALEVFDVPSGVDEFGGEPVEEIRMRGFLSLDTEVFGCFYETGAEIFLPVAIDGDASGVRVIG